MEIIRMFNPQAVKNSAGEMLLRVLTFANNSYALHLVNKKGESLLALFDKDGQPIGSRVRAESAYIFGNGNYILLFEPTNPTAKAGKVRYRREFRLFNRKGQLLCDTISCFTPLPADDMVWLYRQGEKNLYDANFQQQEPKPADALSLLAECKVPAAMLPEAYRDGKDIREFANGCFSCVYAGYRLFFAKGATEPQIIVPDESNVRFLPDGRYWLIEDEIICDGSRHAVLDYADAVIMLDDVYLVCRTKKKEQILFDLDGRQIAAGRQLRGRANGVFAFEDAEGKVNLVHKSGQVIRQGLDPFMPVFAESAI